MARLSAVQNRLPLPLRSRTRRLEARVRGEPAVVVYGQAYQHQLPGAPVDGLRGERILTALVREGLIGRQAVVIPTLAALAKLARVHAPEYLELLTSPAVIEATFGLTLAPDVAERVVELQRHMVGGTMLAARAAQQRHTLAINLAGGLHHAHRGRGGGFCLLNDVAVAIAELRERGFSEPIAVIDLDLHDGDGTRALFAEDPSVWTFSIHNAHWGPTDALSSTAIALGEAVEDAAYMQALRGHLPDMLDRHRPRLVFYVAGCDPAADDALGNWRISEAGMLARDRYVLAQLHARGIESIVWLLGGGYGNEAWRYSARGLIAALDGPTKLELPSTEAITLSRYRHLARVLDPVQLSGRSPGELHFDDSDLFGIAQAPSSPRVLGYYTESGIEFALERYGLLERLRQLGYDPRVEIDVDLTAGDTLRVWGDDDKTLLLIEVRVARDRTTVPGMELLRIEWMLLQNPRASWTGGRVPLPGQRHPGLRMFDDVAILLLLVCERLQFDGIVVVPSHYHVAARWHRRMRFWEPRAEGRFRALQRLLAPLPLAEASTAVELGKVVDLDSGERGGYRPAPLILAASEALRRRFDARWEQQVAAAEASARFRLET